MKHVRRTCLFSNAHNIKGASVTQLLTGKLGYRANVATAPYNIYSGYHRVRRKHFISLVRVSTTSHAGIRSAHSLLSGIRCTPTHNHFGICLVSRIRVLSHRDFGTLLGALRRPPRRIGFLLTAASPRGLPIAVLSHYLRFRLGTLSIRRVHRRLRRVLGRRRVTRRPQTLRLLTHTTRNDLQSTLDLASRTVTDNSNRISARTIDTVLNALSSSRTLSLIRTVIRTGNRHMVTLVGRTTTHNVR